MIKELLNATKRKWIIESKPIELQKLLSENNERWIIEWCQKEIQTNTINRDIIANKIELLPEMKNIYMTANELKIATE